jgi:hypothetical protein
MNKRGLLGLIVVVGVLIVVGFFWFVDEWNSDGEVEGIYDEVEERCVAATCCHAMECVWESEAPDCDGAICDLSCKPGTMDCGVGKCGVVENECGVVWNE